MRFSRNRFRPKFDYAEMDWAEHEGIPQRKGQAISPKIRHYLTIVIIRVKQNFSFLDKKFLISQKTFLKFNQIM